MRACVCVCACVCVLGVVTWSDILVKEYAHLSYLTNAYPFVSLKQTDSPQLQPDEVYAYSTVDVDLRPIFSL